MTNASLDHMLSLTILIAALLIFIGIFSQTVQTGISYQQHTAISTKASDLLDTILLNPGIPFNWSRLDSSPDGFGLQDAEFSQYKLNDISPLRLASIIEQPVYYSRTNVSYSNLTAGYGSCLLTPSTKTIDYSTASKLLGINGTYGFQLTLTPTVTITIEKKSSGAPLQFLIESTGTGSALANANMTYSLIVVNEGETAYPAYTVISGKGITDQAGTTSLTFPGINGENRSYTLIVYSYLYGLKGMGYYVHVPQSFTKTVVPLVDSFENRSIVLAHSDSVGGFQEPSAYSQLSYNATFAILTEEYALRQTILDPAATGKIDCGPGSTLDYTTVTVPDNTGILIVTYNGTTTDQRGIVLVPWGISSMAYQITFGGNSAGYDWVTTDIRQVTIGGIAYQAKLSLWNLQGHMGGG